MKKLALLFLVLFLATNVYAKKGKRFEKRRENAAKNFKRLAGDDNVITLEEFKKNACKRAEEFFKKKDLNNDGKITEDEFKKAGKRKFDRRKKARRERRNKNKSSE